MATKHVPEKKAKNVALFWGIMFSYNIIGSGLAYFALASSTKFYFLTLFILGLSSSVILLFVLPKPEL